MILRLIGQNPQHPTHVTRLPRKFNPQVLTIARMNAVFSTYALSTL